MYYPIWDVPIATAPMVIAFVALIHVFISHYAVGGGLLIARENSRALRNDEDAYREYWKKHAKFFILLTVPLGAITGVGIWFSIGLASPLATETLIRVFAFGWAIEWCFFLLEIVSGFALYYFWDRFTPRVSSFVGWVYGISAWISLVLITGITSFMLNSTGLIDDWESTGNFWHAFLNVQFLPQTIARTGCALTLGSFYVLAHATLMEKNLDVRELVVKRMRLPAFFGLFLIVAGVAGWAYFLPESSRLTLERAAATNIFAGLFVAILVGLTILLIVGPCAKPRETSFGAALAMTLMGFAAVGVAEFVREAVRKPYVVDRVVYGHQILREDVAKLRQTGYLYNGTWTVLELDKLQESYPELAISAERYLGVPTVHLETPEYVLRAKQTDANAEAPNESDAAPVEGEGAAPVEGGENFETSPAQGTDDLLGANRTEYYYQTVAYRQSLGGDSRFAPTSTQASAQTSAQTLNQSAQPLPNGSLNATAPQTFDSAQGLGVQATQNPQPGVRSATRPATRPVAQPATQPAAQPVAQPATRPAAQPVAQPAAQLETASASARRTAARAAAPDPLVETVVPDPQGVTERATPVSAAPATPVAAELFDEAADSVDATALGDANASGENAVVAADASEAKTSAELDLEINGPIARGNEDLLKVSREDRIKLGRTMFLYHCNSCHASSRGYSALGPMTSGLTQEEIAQFALTLNHSHFYMPPWSGTEVEAELLAEYVASISAKTPNNVFLKSKPKKVAPKEDVEGEKGEGEEGSEGREGEGGEGGGLETPAPESSDELSELPSGLGAM